MSEYTKLGGSLKLKGTQLGPTKKKKKSKSSTSDKLREEESGAGGRDGSGSGSGREGSASPAPPPSAGSSSNPAGKTAAQLRFEAVQKQRLLEKAKKAAAKTHKERVADFNEKLENLSEHYDIPKVGPG